VSDRRSQARTHRPTQRAVDRALVRLGDRLRELRDEHEMTLEQAAEAAHLHPVSLSRLENGRVNTTIASLVALSRAYGVELVDLFTDDE